MRGSVISQMRGIGGWRARIAAPIAAAMLPDDARVRIDAVRQSIARAAKIAGRPPESVTLVAISKTHEAQAIRPLIAAGQRVFGENRVQEAAAKWPALREETPDIELHL